MKSELLFQARRADEYEGVYRAKYPKNKTGPKPRIKDDATLQHIRDVGPHEYAAQVLAARKQEIRALIEQLREEVGELNEQEEARIRAEELARCGYAPRKASDVPPKT